MSFASALPGRWRKDAEEKCFMENHSKLKPNFCYFIEIVFSPTDTSIL